MESDEKTKSEPKASGVMDELWEKVPYTYVNSSQTVGSNWDVRFVFSERLPNDTVQPRVGIVMSPQHAKALLGALTTTIEKLEGMLGPIKFDAEKSEKSKDEADKTHMSQP
jgi:hypothetical protein